MKKFWAQWGWSETIALASLAVAITSFIMPETRCFFGLKSEVCFAAEASNTNYADSPSEKHDGEGTAPSAPQTSNPLGADVSDAGSTDASAQLNRDKSISETAKQIPTEVPINPSGPDVFEQSISLDSSPVNPAIDAANTPQPKDNVAKDQVTVPALKAGIYNVGSRYIQIVHAGNRTCYQGMSMPSGRYAVAVGETTGSVSLNGKALVIDGWLDYGVSLQLAQQGENLLVTGEADGRQYSYEYDFWPESWADEEPSEVLQRCLAAQGPFFELAPGYSINR